jgi:hypothetical protein
MKERNRVVFLILAIAVMALIGLTFTYEKEPSTATVSSSLIASESMVVSSNLNVGFSMSSEQNTADDTSKITYTVSDQLKSLYSEMSVTNQWTALYGQIVLFGSLKSDPQQGIALVVDTLNNNSIQKYLTPSKHGVIHASSLLGSSSAIEVSAEDGHIWIFHLYGDGFAEKVSGDKYAGGWLQLDRLRYVGGTVDSIQKNTDGTAVVNLQVTVNYHVGTDPVDNPNFPFSIGHTADFILQCLPKPGVNKGDYVVLYECDVTPLSGSVDQFVGATIMYFKKGKGFFDINGRTVTMPPKDTPEFQQVFITKTFKP